MSNSTEHSLQMDNVRKTVNSAVIMCGGEGRIEICTNVNGKQSTGKKFRIWQSYAHKLCTVLQLGNKLASQAVPVSNGII